MSPVAGWPQTLGEVAATAVLYRLLISPAVRWTARRLGAGIYPAKAANGTYPEAPADGRGVLAALLVVAPPTAAAFVVGATPPGPVAWLPAAALAAVLWKHLTFDYDAARDPRWQRRDRIAVAIVGAGAFVWPSLALAAAVAVCGRLGAWTHHSMASLRILKATFAWSLAAGAYRHATGTRVPPSADVSLLIVLGAVFLSHYVVACVSKLRLGARPWHWVTLNRTDLLVACAYSWGWAGFLPERLVLGIIRAVGRGAVWLNATTIVIEALGLAAFGSRDLLAAAALGAVAFNAIVAVTSGLFFWENMAVGAVLAAVALDAPEAAFGVAPWLIGAGLTVLVLAGWLWQPTGLGWWDTPFAARVYWTGRTADGALVGIHNDFMSPFDREYARALGNPLTDEPFVTFPLGGVEDAALRERLLALPGDLADLAAVKRDYGRSHADPRARERHTEYLRALFAGLAAGAPKSPLPRSLRWLKAPGGHLYYWGDLPRLRRDGARVVWVQARYREICFDPVGHRWIRLRDEPVLEVPIGDTVIRPAGPPADGPERKTGGLTSIEH